MGLVNEKQTQWLGPSHKQSQPINTVLQEHKKEGCNLIGSNINNLDAENQITDCIFKTSQRTEGILKAISSRASVLSFTVSNIR